MEAIKVFTREFPSNITLLPLGDLHIDQNCDVEWLEHQVKEIRSNGYYTLLVGDLFDVGFFNQVRVMQEKEQTLNDGMRILKGLLNPIKDRILVMVEGNHDRRIAKATGFDILEEFSDDLGIPYSRGQAVLNLRVGQRQSNPRAGKYSYALNVTHGWGGGRTRGAKANKISQWLEGWEGIDLFIMGHVHAPMSLPSARYAFDSRTRTIRRIHIRSIILSAFQKGTLYAAQAGYPPSSRVDYLIKLSSTQKKIEITERTF